MSSSAHDHPGQPRPAHRTAVRIFDITLAIAALAAVGAPLLLALAVGRLAGTPCWGAGGRTFVRMHLVLPDTIAGRLLARLGCEQWPSLWNVLAGQMAWVGPGAVAARAGQGGFHGHVRPGLVSLWDLRRLLAIDSAGEQQAAQDYLAHRSARHDIGLLARYAFVRIFTSGGQAREARVRVGGVTFDNLDRAQAIERIGAMLEGGRACQVHFVNPACVNIAAGDRHYRRVLGRSDLVLPDGIGIKLACDILGTPLRQNLNGTDLFAPLCDMLAARRARVFLLGGRPEVVERVSRAVRERWPSLVIAGARDGYFASHEESDVVAQVRSSRADFLFVAQGAPMQETFIDRQLPHLGVKVAMGVGGLFDFVSGRIPRAPRWMREGGLEWVWRLLQEPARMWRRYLIGNVTFLARVVATRATGARAAVPAADRDPAAAVADDTIGVLMATEPATADIPVERGTPAGLLPFGQTTFIEQAVAQMAASGIRTVHVIACARPDELRRVLGDGSRWGVLLAVRACKDEADCHHALRLLADQAGRRVVLAFAHCWIEPLAVSRLAHDHLYACGPASAQQDGWSGWASVKPWLLYPLSKCRNMADVSRELRCRMPDQLLLEAGQCARPSGAAGLMAAQVHAMSPDVVACVPQPWLSMPWGLLSPLAKLHPGAVVQGPACIGPGCAVAAGAVVGPAAILTRDIAVGRGSTVASAMVMPDTFVGADLDVRQAIVNGNVLQCVDSDVRLVLDPADALLTRLRNVQARRSGLQGRALALLALVALAPCIALAAAVRRSRGASPLWIQRRVDPGRPRPMQAGPSSPLRIPAPDGARWESLAALGGPILDVVRGRRCWIGTRPRNDADWAALPEDWQALLDESAIGVFHAPAWTDTPSAGPEAEAVADLALVSTASAIDRWRLVVAGIRSGGHCIRAREASGQFQATRHILQGEALHAR